MCLVSDPALTIYWHFYHDGMIGWWWRCAYTYIAWDADYLFDRLYRWVICYFSFVLYIQRFCRVEIGSYLRDSQLGYLWPWNLMSCQHRTMQIEDSAQTALIIVGNFLIRKPDNEAESENVLVKRPVAWGRWADIVDIEICTRTWVACESSVCFVWIFPLLTVYICSGLGRPKQCLLSFPVFKLPPVQLFRAQHLCWAPRLILPLVSQSSDGNHPSISFRWSKPWMVVYKPLPHIHQVRLLSTPILWRYDLSLRRS